MAGSLFWLSEEAWITIEPHLPSNQPGGAAGRRPASDLRHRTHAQMREGAGRTVRARMVPRRLSIIAGTGWSRRGVWERILAALTNEGRIAETAQIDSSYVKAHGVPAAQKGGACQGSGDAKHRWKAGGGGSSPGHWHLAWWSDDEDPRACRCPRTPASSRANAAIVPISQAPAYSSVKLAA
jgi:transposase